MAGTNSVFIVGFHRSATSLLSSILENSGLFVGAYLMPGALSNPLGHHEDMAVVNLHDGALLVNGVDWRCEGNIGPIEGWLSDFFTRYLYYRKKLSKEKYFGVKDPRACLFLEEWRKAAGSCGRYIVVVRHWSGNFQSLCRRHSGSISLSEGPSEIDGSFWFNPLLAADMWLTYNRNILEFLRSCPVNQRLTITHQAVLSGLNLPALVNDRFDLDLDESVPSPIKKSLVHDRIEQSVRERLPESKIAEMEEVWQALLQFADHRAPNEEPNWIPDVELKCDQLSVYEGLLSAAEKVEPTVGLGPIPEDLEALLDYARINPLVKLSVDELWQRVKLEATHHPEMWEKLATALKARGHVDKAENALNQVLLSGKTPPYIYMLLGTCREAEFDFEGAEHFYRIALSRNPANPVFHVRMAYLYLVLARYEEAEALLRKGIDSGNTKPLMFHALANVLDQQGKTEEALKLLEAQADRPELLEKQRMTLLMKIDYPAGQKLYKEWARQRTQRPEVRAQVVKTLATVPDLAARKDLARRIVLAWQ
ncbi:tetratricopeptide repeat protein [Marinobacter sp. ATCH36]|uniref:tetratricopeptide repeat protein n=1 Tax=Marinobacter sp. ATCH36 TaxID=2945106 RepID=UPI0020206699|nr:tetratricopeptide repeat protein [Marinobacter sp. ATCH36]MCL7945136.1 tetratricopeptide repeat protein [Marinobacter sp. ATCH36]